MIIIIIVFDQMLSWTLSYQKLHLLTSLRVRTRSSSKWSNVVCNFFYNDYLKLLVLIQVSCSSSTFKETEERACTYLCLLSSASKEFSPSVGGGCVGISNYIKAFMLLEGPQFWALDSMKHTRENTAKHINQLSRQVYRELYMYNIHPLGNDKLISRYGGGNTMQG